MFIKTTQRAGIITLALLLGVFLSQEKLAMAHGGANPATDASSAHTAAVQTGEDSGGSLRAGSDDCNGNDVGDDDDIGAGTSSDCNSNGIPDECDLADPWQVAQLLQGDPTALARFGGSIAIGGDLAVVGAPEANDGAPASGAAYVFRNSGGAWEQVAKLTAGADTAPGSRFGIGVAVDGGTVVVGAYGDYYTAHDGGAAYLFREVGGIWTRVAKLMAGDPSAGDFFGYSVAIEGDLVVVGARQKDSTGAAYVFREVAGDWQQIGKLLDDAIYPNWPAQSGSSVALSYPWVVVGAPADQVNGKPYAGSAAVFKDVAGAWTRVARLTDDVPDGPERFGVSVAIDEETMVVGCLADKDHGWQSGSASVFRNVGGQWQPETKLIADDTVANDFFGGSVDVAGGNLVIGATGDQSVPGTAGSVYLYRRSSDGWSQAAEFRTADLTAGAFGGSVALHGSTLVVGAPYTLSPCTQCGTAFVFGVPDSWDRNANAVPDECEFGDLDGNGTVDLADFLLMALCPWGPSRFPVAALPSPCGMADFDLDNDVDLHDFAAFQQAARMLSRQ